MEARALNLESALNSPEVDFYTIPSFQRPYTWDREHYETLWNDLSEAFISIGKALNRKKQKTLAGDNSYYFLGPAVFVKNTAHRTFDIIDGQQRTTTIHVLLWYLYKNIGDSDEKNRLAQILMRFGNRDSRLQVSQRDAATFLMIRESDDLIPGDSKLAAVANYFREQVIIHKRLKDFAKFILEKTQFIVITAEDYRRAWELFIGLNGKGEPLNPTDLVKAYVCGNAVSGDRIGDIWEQKILPLHDESTQYLLFLARRKAKKLINENDLFKNFTELYPAKLSTVDIAEYADVFRLFWQTPVDDIKQEFPNGLKFTTKARKNLRLVRDLDRRDITFIIFMISEAYGREFIFDESLLSLFSTFQIRMAIARKRSREQKIVSEFAKISFVNLSFSKAIDRITKFVKSDAPDDKQFEEYVRLADYGSYPGRMILKYYEEGVRGNKVITDFHLEHLMPQTGTKFWFRAAGTTDDDDYGKIVNSIGNLFIIDHKTNIEVKNKTYSQKKNYYKKHLGDWSIARITTKKASWKPKDIQDRATTIASWSKKCWKF